MLFILKILSWLSDRVVENVEACSEKEGLMLKLFQRSRRCDALPRLRRQILHAIHSYKKHLTDFFDFLGNNYIYSLNCQETHWSQIFFNLIPFLTRRKVKQIRGASSNVEGTICF